MKLHKHVSDDLKTWPLKNLKSELSALLSDSERGFHDGDAIENVKKELKKRGVKQRP